jgi:tetratricopeptide (TPR) repeat protein
MENTHIWINDEKEKLNQPEIKQELKDSWTNREKIELNQQINKNWVFSKLKKFVSNFVSNVLNKKENNKTEKENDKITYTEKLTKGLDIRLNPNCLNDRINKWNDLLLWWQNEEALKMFDKAIELNSENSGAYNGRWWAFLNLWQNEEMQEMLNESIEMFDKAIELNFSYQDAYNGRWWALFNLWQNEKALEMFDKVIELNPRDSNGYSNKWEALLELWMNTIWELYEFTSNLLAYEWQNYEWQNNKKERQRIRGLVKECNFEWLKNYLLKLEKRTPKLTLVK